MSKRWSILIPVLALVAGLLFLVNRALNRGHQPNVILITVDTLRADHLGVYGYGRPTSPNFDLLAKESILFRRGFAQAPETNPSLASLMTSKLPHETQVLRNFHQLQPGVSTLAERLRAAGWRTGAVVSNYSLRRGSGFEQGFDDYDDRMEDLNAPTWEGVERVASKTTAAASEWLRKHAGERFFLWVHYMDPHAPYMPPAPYTFMWADNTGGTSTPLPILSGRLGGSGTGGIPYYAQLAGHKDAEYYISQYDGEIRFFDHWLGELLEELRTLALLEGSLLIVTADHGEGMGEHQYYFNHLEFVYNGLIHVPLLMRLPGKAAGKEVDTPVALLDVLPTILQTVSIETDTSLLGHSLVNPEPRPIWAETHFMIPKAAVLFNGRKLILSEDTKELYDLDNDFYETHSLLESGSIKDLAVAQALKQRIDEIRSQDSLGLGAPVNWKILPDELLKMKALGYVQ